MEQERNHDGAGPTYVLPQDGWSARWHLGPGALVIASHPAFDVELHYRVNMEGDIKPLSIYGHQPGPLQAAKDAVDAIVPAVFPLHLGLRLAWEHQVAQEEAEQAREEHQPELRRKAARCHLQLVAETMRTPTERAVARELLARGFTGTAEELQVMVADTIGILEL